MREDLCGMDFRPALWSRPSARSMARIEPRRYRSKDTSAPEWVCHAALHGLRQAIRIEREWHQGKAG